MNLTRRHLFRTLSAIAVAPLAKWLPKKELEIRSLGSGIVISGEPAVIEIDESLIRVIPGPLLSCTESAIYMREATPPSPKWVKCETELKTIDGNLTLTIKPATQEEA